MTKHTPGPWAFKPHEMGTFVRCEKGYIISGPVNERPGHEANARLIAAAPELLEALKVAEQFMAIASDWNIDEAEINGEMRSTYDWLDLVRAAIATATGEQND